MAKALKSFPLLPLKRRSFHGLKPDPVSRLDCLDDALIALAAFLDAHEHGPACVCGPCTAYQQATALLPRLGHVLAILEAWARGEAEEPIVPEDLTYLLTVVLEHDHPAEREPERPADGAGEGEG